MLRGELTAQLPLQAGLTCEARLAPAFTASALVSFPLADLLAHARIFFNRLWRFWNELDRFRYLLALRAFPFWVALVGSCFNRLVCFHCFCAVRFRWAFAYWAVLLVRLG